MTSEPPDLIAIDHDDYHAEHVGHTRDGRQFFLTTPFEPPHGDDQGGEYVALFLFDGEGNLLAAEIDDFGPRRPSTTMRCDACTTAVSQSWAT